MRRLEEMQQPNGAFITIDIMQMDGFSEEDLKKLNEKHRFHAEIYIDWGFNSHHVPREIKKTLYGDEKGLYTYKNQKIPFYFWKSQNIEEDYDNWIKTSKGYKIPLNQPRKLKKVIFG